MKKPKSVEWICKKCYSRFISEPIEDWEYNEKGDDKLVGYFHSKVCKQCIDYENNLSRGSKEYGEILYNQGLITLDQLKKEYK